MLHAAVHEDYLFPGACIVSDNFLAAHLIDKVDFSIVFLSHLLVTSVDDYAAGHHTAFSEHFCKFPGVNAGNPYDFFSLEPFRKAFNSIPVTVFSTVFAYDERFCMNPRTFHERCQAVVLNRERRNAIVSYERVCQHHELSRIRRVRKAFRIAAHRRVENDLTAYRFLITEGFSFKAHPVVKNKGCRSCLSIFLLCHKMSDFSIYSINALFTNLLPPGVG